MNWIFYRQQCCESFSMCKSNHNMTKLISVKKGFLLDSMRRIVSSTNYESFVTSLSVTNSISHFSIEFTLIIHINHHLHVVEWSLRCKWEIKRSKCLWIEINQMWVECKQRSGCSSDNKDRRRWMTWKGLSLREGDLPWMLLHNRWKLNISHDVLQNCRLKINFSEK
jgi:hypothetical protein